MRDIIRGWVSGIGSPLTTIARDCSRTRHPAFMPSGFHVGTVLWRASRETYLQNYGVPDTGMLEATNRMAGQGLVDDSASP
jgi:hypothetical protein